MGRARGPASAACAYLHDAYRASLAHPRVRRLLTPRSGAAPQARDCGFSDHATAAQLATATLLRRADLVADHMRRVRLALAWRAPAASLARSSRHDALGFASLPHAVALYVFSFLPADQRARAAVICRAWCAAVAEPSLWTRLDLSPASGVLQPVTDAMLRGAAALARGALEVLVLDGCDAISQDVQTEIVTANSGSLRELSCCYENGTALFAGVLEALVLAAPQLQLFQAGTKASVADAIRMLRNEAPFGALRMRHLWVEHDDEQANVDETTVLELAAAMPRHASLTSLGLNNVRLFTPAALDAVTAAALACGLRGLMLKRCSLSPASVPALVRLIGGGALASIHIDNEHSQLLDEPDAMELADAIAASRTLTRFALGLVDFWSDGVAAAAVVRALTGHPSVRVLKLAFNEPDDPAAAGAALGALVAANTPALQELDMQGSGFLDAGLGPLFDALPHNTHLRHLECYCTGMTADFARDRFLPAVRANTSLRKLIASPWWDNEEHGEAPPEVLEAEALVAARAAAEAAS